MSSVAPIVTFFFLTLPWLNPFSPGPTPAVMPWLTSLACFALVLLAARRLPPAQVAENVARAWLAAALLSAVLGLLQYFGATAAFAPWVNGTNLGEAFGNLRQRNQFATLTNIGLAALLWWVAQARAAASPTLATPPDAARPAPLAGQFPALAAAVLLALANAASSSRTGLAQLLLLIAMTWAWRRHAAGAASGARPGPAGRILLAAALAYAAAAWALPALAGLDPHASGILSRLHEGGPTCGSRLTLWGNVLHLIGQKPWFGWGWGQLDYAHFMTLYPGARFCEILDNAHNLPLHLAVELGLPLALALCGGGLWLVWRAKPWHEVNATRQLAWAVLAVILLHSLLEYPLWYGPFQIASALSLWLLWRTPRLRSARLEPLGALASALSAWLAIAMLAAAGYAAWDYQRISQIYLEPSLRSPAYRDNTLERISDSWLFRDQVRFAELTTTALTPENAAHINRLTRAMLHFSPEPRVIEKLIESATLLGRDDEAVFYLARYKEAFPESQARWAAENAVR